MTSVAIHLTDAGVHVNSRGIPFPGSASVGMVEGAKAPATAHVRRGQFSLPNAEDDFTLTADGVRSSDEAFSAIVADVLAGVGHDTAVDSVALTHPSHWGETRRNLFRNVATRLVPDAVTVPLAIVVVTAAASDTSSENLRCVVVEDGDVGPVVTYVDYSLGECTILECDIDVDDEGIAVVVGRVAGGRPVDAVLMCLTEAATDSAEFRRTITEVCGSGTTVRHFSAPEVSASLDKNWGRPEIEVRSERVSTRAHWLTATEHGDESSRRPMLLAAAAAVVLAVCAAAVTVYATSSSESAAATDSPDRPFSDVPAPSRTSVPTSSPATSAQRPSSAELGRLHVELPAGWESASSSSGSSSAQDRFELRPVSGDPLRVVLVQKDIRDGAGYEDVADSLQQQIEARGNLEMFTGLERDVIFGGRPGIAYSEFPDGRSQVDWHVLIDQGMQVSVGCQFDRAQQADIAKPCEQIVRSLEVVE